MTLAERVNDLVFDYDPWGYVDSDCSPQYFEDLIENNPKAVIEELVNMLEKEDKNV